MLKLFRFLIGRIKTKVIIEDITIITVFQFLIGRLKTGKSTGWIPIYLEMFQFLIGRLKTKSKR